MDAEEMAEVIREANESEADSGIRVDSRANLSTILGSALGMGRIMQAFIYLVALSVIVLVLAAKSTRYGESESGSASSSSSFRDADGLGDGRRLGGGPSPLMLNIAYSISCAGLLTFFVSLLKQPLILGYLLGGMLVGPIGLDIVHSHEDIAELSSLGLVFLLFMIGLELDVSELLKMGKVVICTGLCQFPICVTVMFGLLKGLEALGLSWGLGDYATFYCAVTCGISSTMIVVKLLGDMAETDSTPGRLTIGILIFQDIWAIIVLAIQPDLANPQVMGLLKTFGLIIALIIVALAYAKFVMPAVFFIASGSVELMLVMALSWCFFMCCLATLPFIGLSMELAALISGVALATFPYSAEFNGKIKFIRDFFITLFFVALGMQIPVPSVGAILTAAVLAIVVLAVRWIGIFAVVYFAGGDKRLATISTINLSQISEFALVICSLGITEGHVGEDTLVILIWTFSMLAILSSNMIGHNYAIYGMLAKGCRKCRRRKSIARGDSRDRANTDELNEEEEYHANRDIVFLGFHRVAAMLLAHCEHSNPKMLEHMHVIDFHQDIMPEIRKKGVTCAYGDISVADVLEHAHHGECRLVIISIPDSILRGTSNLRLLQVAKSVWPKADVICTADSAAQAHALYEAGADYVLRMAKLCAERLQDLIIDHTSHAVHHHVIGEEMNLNHVFDFYKRHDDDKHLQHIKF
eukprot:TRINITY_DN16870_c0_g3_i1.p1 TRINITY_DN16870_c0_g3~~TRINITY_DN16870_c0_g3_i1.p1  ORF type:complete len:820 (-),score=154.88 TRINITY_DN16870_c0_g3_i1:36-2126(-)